MQTSMAPICFVVTTPFAVNAFLLNHLNELSKNYRVTLCVNLEAYPLSERLSSRVMVINMPIARKISLIQDFRALICLWGLFRTQKFKAVHSITPKAGLLAMITAFMNRVPHRYHTFTGQVWVTRKGIRKVLLKSFDKLITALSTRVFSDSQSQSRFLQSQGISKGGVVSVLGGGSIAGVSLERFKPDEKIREKTRLLLKAKNECCVFLFVGRLTRDKGVADLVEAFADLHKKNRSAALWIVGPDEEGLQNKLSSSIETLESGIVWIGPTAEPETYMTAADVLVLPSYREGFGMVIIEAAACATPALAYRIDGVVDAVADGQTGILLEPGNTSQLSNAMATMASDISLRHDMGLRALERARKEFSAKAVTTAWIDFYSVELSA